MNLPRPLIPPIVALFLLISSLQPALGWNTLPSRATDQPGFSFTPSPGDWRTANIYHIVTDRFFDGESGNNNARNGFNASDGHKAHGGDWKGLQQKLDYLQTLGVKAIWISPVSYNIDFTTDVLGNVYVPYHGYMPTDLNTVNPVMGSLTDLRNLIDAAHARGIYVILDIVVNHLADLMSSQTSSLNNQYNINEYNNPVWHRGFSHAEPFNSHDKFHKNGKIENYDDINQYLRGELTGGLDDIKTEDSTIRNDLAAIFKALISATDCDGFRIDAVKHVELDFWDSFMPQLRSHASSLGKTNFLAFGEVFSGNDAFVGSFTSASRFHSMLNFPMFSTIKDVFVNNFSTKDISDRLAAQTNYFAPARGQLINFLDNHDTPRILNSTLLNNNWARLKTALTFLYTSQNIPCIYYGTEQGFDGGADPWNREDMWDGSFEGGPSNGDNFNTGHELFLHIKTLNTLRTNYPALTLGTFEQKWQEFGGAGIYAYTKQYSNTEVIVVLNTSSSSKSCTPGALLPAGTVYRNMLATNELFTVTAGGNLPVTNAAYSSKVLVPAINADPSSVEFSPAQPDGCGAVTITYRPGDGPLKNVSPVRIFIGHDSWQDIIEPYPAMTPSSTNAWTYVYTPPAGVGRIDCVFNNGSNIWDNNGGADWHVTVSNCPAPPVALVEGSPQILSGGTPNVAGERVDFSQAGGAAIQKFQGGFGNPGKLYLNYDATNLYIGAINCDMAGSNNASAVFLGLDTLGDDASNLWNLNGAPRGLDQLHNIAFTTPLDIGILVGDEWGDGVFTNFDLAGGYNMGQGAYYLSTGGSNFVPVGGARLSQFDGDGTNATSGADDDGSRSTRRWELAIPWASLNAAGVASISNLHLAAVLVSSATNGNDRYLSGNMIADAVSGPLANGNYGFGFATITPRSIELPANPDSDNDGLPDAWELLYFGSLGVLGNATDYDVDGQSDWNEYLSGTNPTNANSLFEVAGANPGASAILQWSSATGRTYSIKSNTNLFNSIWLTVTSGIPATPPLNIHTTATDAATTFFLITTP